MFNQGKLVHGFPYCYQRVCKKEKKGKKKSSISHLVKQLKVLHFAFCQFRIAVS